MRERERERNKILIWQEKFSFNVGASKSNRFKPVEPNYSL